MEYPQSLRSLEDQGRLFGTERPALHPRRRSGPAFDRALDEVRSRPERPACERGEDAEAPERARAERATEAPRDEEAAPRPETPVPQQGSAPESAPRSARPQAPTVGDPLPAEAAVRTSIEPRVDAGRQPLEGLEDPALPPAPATRPGAPTGSETGRVQPPLQSTAAEEPLPEIDRLAAPVAEVGLDPALDKLSAPRARAAAAPAQTTAPLAAAPASVEGGPGGPEATRPTAVADPQPGRPALDPEAAADVLKQVRLQLWPGLRQASIQLHPANLGQVSIRLAMEGGRMRAVIRVERPETLRALERHAPELRAALQAQGLEAESLDLALDSRESGADGSTRGSNEAGARQRASAATRTGAEAAPESEARPDLLRTLLSETSVDTYA